MYPEDWKRLIVLIFIMIGMPFGTTKELSTSDLTRKFSEIFKSYDKRVLPSLDGNPVNVSMQIYIVDMVPLKRYHMHYEINAFVRQIWKDYRLNMTMGDLQWNAFGIDTLNDIWVPEIYFPSAKKGKWYHLMKKNTALHIRKGGTTFLSRRVSLTLYCPMDLRNFPFDGQECQMDIRLYAYNNEHCRLNWNIEKGGPIFLADPMQISEFSLKEFSNKKEIDDLSTAGKFDKLSVTFRLERTKSHYLINYMLPSGMIVVLSWVGFWIDYRATPARCSLAITTVLTITTLTNSIRAGLPHVGYIKAIDIYLLSCFFFVFASTIEFAITGVTHKKWIEVYENQRQNAGGNANNQKKKENEQGAGLQTLSSQETSSKEDERTEEVVNGCEANEISYAVPSALYINEPVSTHQRKGKFEINNNSESTESRRKQSTRNGCLARHWHALVEKLIVKHYKTRREVHIIDKISRALFPAVFLVFNVAFFMIVFFI